MQVQIMALRVPVSIAYIVSLERIEVVIAALDRLDSVNRLT